MRLSLIKRKSSKRSVFLLILLHDIDEDDTLASFAIEGEKEFIDIIDHIYETTILIFARLTYGFSLRLTDRLELITEYFQSVDISVFFELLIGVTRLIEESIERLTTESEEIIEDICDDIGSHKDEL